jgi:glycosyltransferase involved in cell wall biosynthesis
MISVGLDISGLDPAFKSHAQRGIGRYVQELHRYMQNHTCPDVSVDLFDHTSLVQGGLGSTLINCMPCGRTTLRQQLLYPLRLNQGAMKKFSFVHFPAHMDAPAWSTKPFVLTVLDLIPLVLSDLYRANKTGLRYRFARWLELKSIREATLLLAISENTANDITRVLGIPREKIVVTPLGVDERFFKTFSDRNAEEGREGRAIRSRLGIPVERPIILYVGGHDERKNIRVLIEIARKVISSDALSNGKKPLLVLAGRVHSELEKKRLAEALDQLDMRRDTTVLGYVSDADLHELYAESSVFLFPSLYEGFGLPALEAMAAGLPVVSSNTSSMPEVVGDTGLLFNPRSVEEGVRGVLTILSNPSAAKDFSDRGHHRARQFSWLDTGRRTVDAYRQAALLAESKGSYKAHLPHPFVAPLGEEGSRAQ